jgi:pyridoxal biosynthesis lyase PdxS
VNSAPRAVRTAAPVVLTSAADRRRSLSNGALVQASIRARLLGIPLLRLDATVVLVPAEIEAPSSPFHEPARTRSFDSGAAGRGLAEAVRRINEGAEVLAKARRSGA